MNILVIDTSTPLLSLGISSDSGWVDSSIALGLTHSENLFPAIQFLASQSGTNLMNLDLVICSKGPGSFTGLRIGFSAAKGISLASGCPLISVPTLDAYAYEFRFLPGIVVPIIDAKKKHLFTALYEKGSRKSDYLDISPADLVKKLETRTEPLYLAGPDYKLLEPYFSDKVRPSPASADFTGKARSFLELGLDLFKKGFTDADGSGPVYLRESEAEISLFKKDSPCSPRPGDI